MAVRVFFSLMTHKTELIVRGVYGAGKTQCIALLAAFFALRGHHVYYASRENTTIVAMATFVHQLVPQAPDDEWPVAIRLPIPARAHLLMPVTLTATPRFGMHSLSWPPRVSTWPSFGISIDPLRKQWIMLNFSFMMKRSRRRPSATSPSLGRYLESALSCVSVIPSRHPAARAPVTSYGWSLTISRWASVPGGGLTCLRPFLLWSTLLIDDLPFFCRRRLKDLVGHRSP